MAKLPETYVPGFHNEEAVRKMKYNDFGETGMKLSVIGLGTAGFGGLFGRFKSEDCQETVLKALKCGINYIDTAPFYGDSEEILGTCLKDVPRKSYYLGTKVGRYEHNVKKMFDFSAQKTRSSVETSLKKLGVDYLDIIQVHDIEFASSPDIIVNETLPALAEFVKCGKVRFIGVTGYIISALKELIERSSVKIDIVLNYCRLTLFDQSLNQYLPYFQSKKLGIFNASAVALGLLTMNGPQPWIPAEKDTIDVCTEAREYCKKQGVDLSKLALYFTLHQPGPHVHMLGMNTVQMLDTNLDVLYNGLTKKELDTMTYLQREIFPKMKKTHWEGNEVEKVKRKLREL